MKPEDIKHILVIRLSALGDVAMTVPVLQRLSKQHPGLKITVLTRTFFKPLFVGIPELTVYEADVKGRHKGIAGLWQLAGELQAMKIDVVADLHNVLRSNILKFFFRLKGMPVIQIDKGRAEKKALTRAENKLFVQLKTTHQRYADVFDRLKLNTDLSKPVNRLKQDLSNNIHEVLGTDTRKWIGIAPFAAFEGKMYPLDLMEDVIARLNSLNSYRIILFGGGEKEKNVLDALADKYENAVSVVKRFSFEDELRLISNLDLMLSMDSGNAHLAANYGVEVVTLWGVTHPFAGFYPFGQPMENALLADRIRYPLIPTSVYGNKFPEGYENAMRTIHPSDVVSKITGILG